MSLSISMEGAIRNRQSSGRRQNLWVNLRTRAGVPRASRGSLSGRSERRSRQIIIFVIDSCDILHRIQI